MKKDKIMEALSRAAEEMEYGAFVRVASNFVQFYPEFMEDVKSLITYSLWVNSNPQPYHWYSVN